MADFSKKKITDLTEKTEPGNNDLFVAGNNGTATMRKISFANIANGIISKLTGAVSSILSNNLTASRALISNSSGKVAASGVSSTELGYLSGASSNIQSQLSALNSNIGNATKLIDTSITQAGSLNIPNYTNYRGLLVMVMGDSNNGVSAFIPKGLYTYNIPLSLNSKNNALVNDGTGFAASVQGYVNNGVIKINYVHFSGWDKLQVLAFGVS